MCYSAGMTSINKFCRLAAFLLTGHGCCPGTTSPYRRSACCHVAPILFVAQGAFRARISQEVRANIPCLSQSMSIPPAKQPARESKSYKPTKQTTHVYTYEHPSIHPSIQACMSDCRHAETHVRCTLCMHVYRQTDRQVDRQKDRQTDRQKS